MEDNIEFFKESIKGFVKTYDSLTKKKDHKPGEKRISTGGAVLGIEERLALLDSVFDLWLTGGPKVTEFEKSFSSFVGAKYSMMTNSGSSANLLAFSALTSPSLRERRIKKGDEVITVAAGFPTTVNPIIQFGAVPVFVDITLPSFNINIHRMKEALSPKTKAVMIAHTLGNPFDVREVGKFCKENNLWLIEDCCDSLGSTWGAHHVGSFGDIATYSFFPAHQITTGEGGMVTTDSPKLKRIIESFRDWGKACWCGPGQDNCCGQRFCIKSGDLPLGYDHKYTFTHVGYNLKVTEMQGALGLAQMQKLPKFIEARRRNHKHLFNALYESKYFVLQEADEHTLPSWFGFLMGIVKQAPFTRKEFIDYLESKNIQTRMLFGGNLTKHPGYEGVNYRVVGDLMMSDFVMENALWIGCNPTISLPEIGYMVETIKEFTAKYD